MQLRIQFEWLLMSIHFSTYFLFLLIIWWFLSSRTGEVTSPVWTLLHLTLCQLQVRRTVVSAASADVLYEIWCPLLSAVHWSWNTEGKGLKYYNVFWRYLCFIWHQWFESPFCVSSLVHELRPADIKVVAALGDSTTVSVVIHRYPVYYSQKNERKKRSNTKQQQTRTYC